MKSYDHFDVQKFYRYKAFIFECQTKSYGDHVVLHNHHIIPKNLGGGNDKDNLVVLSVEDHITAHILLSECFADDTDARINNLRSARFLNKNSIRDREVLDEISKTYCGENNPFYGKKHTDETKQILSIKSTLHKAGKTYEDLYGDESENEKEKRSVGVSKYHDSLTKEEKQVRSKNLSLGLRALPEEERKTRARMAALTNVPRVLVNGIEFDCVVDACRYFNVTRYYLKKLYTIEVLNEKNS